MTKPLKILLGPAERRALDNAAKQLGLPTSTWARFELLKLADVYLGEPAATWATKFGRNKKRGHKK